MQMLWVYGQFNVLLFQSGVRLLTSESDSKVVFRAVMVNLMVDLVCSHPGLNYVDSNTVSRGC